MKKQDFGVFLQFALKVIITHTMTYFIFGLVMSNVFHYERLFQQDIIKDFMRPIGSPYVLAGPFLQPLRGLLFAIGLWPIRNFILSKKHGWLILWNIFVMFGILSTPAAAPCSIEGVIYSKLPFWYHLIGLPEIMLQTLTVSLVLVWWDKRLYQETKSSEAKIAIPSLWPEVMKAIMTGCFAYLGYVVGGLLIFAMSDVQVDMDAAAGDLKIQLMFVVAFVFNVMGVFFISKQWLRGKMALWLIFGIFWMIDAVVPFLYQLLIFGESSLPMTLLLGFFPAVIIAVSMYINYKKSS